MLVALVGNRTVERVLYFLSAYGEGYAAGMAAGLGIPLNGVQQQLRRLERGGVVVSRRLGRLRLYQLNPRWYFLPELRALLDKAVAALPAAERERDYRGRTRPRRAGKP